jgi:small subunit ribosomal protein S1
VVSEGQAVKVKIKKYDPATGRISLAYREMLPDPWEEVEQKYPQGTQVPGRVTKLMDFGAFVELEPGVEGLVHISELSHKKIWRVSDVVKEGEQVEVRVQSIDRAARRISLSIKDLTPAPETETKGKVDDEPGEPAQKSKVQRSAKKPLKGGVSRSSEGEKFGLKW